MGIIKSLGEIVYKLIKRYRLRVITRLLDKRSKTLLDIGCQDLFYYHHMKEKYKVTLADYFPHDNLIMKEDVQNLSFRNKSFDIVLCQEVLEHVPNPVKAMLELKRVAKKQLIISVPYEPFFTMFRFFARDKEHLWTITPEVLEHHLGKPDVSKKLFFKRYYVTVWKLG